MFTDEQINDLVELLTTLDENTKIYIGCDSIRYFRNGIQMAKYATVAVVHKNGKNGCRLFSTIDSEAVYDVKPNRPKMRMMGEVIRTCQLYNQLAPWIDCYDVEIHLDIATDPKQGSNCAMQEATGYVLGMCGIEPKLKPEAWCASFGGDWAVHKMLEGSYT